MFIAISQAQKEMHVKMGLPEEKIRVIPHFLDAGSEPVSSPPVDGHILFLGRISEEKGVKLLLEAWQKVDSGRRKLRIVGEGPELPAMKRLARNLVLRQVEFLGFVPKSRHPDLWSSTSVLVAPSVWMEPFGMVVLEAWREGRPIVATTLGSFPELIEDERDGWLADPTPAAFAEALQKALDSGERCIEMGERGRVKLEQEFNKDRWLRQISAFYPGG